MKMLQRSKVVEYSIPFEQVSFRIVIKMPGNSLDMTTYLKGEL